MKQNKKEGIEKETKNEENEGEAGKIVNEGNDKLKENME
jgi:hypothetical protein